MALDTVSAAVDALFASEASCTDIQAADALITRALHLLPAKQLQKALVLVDQVVSRRSSACSGDKC